MSAQDTFIAWLTDKQLDKNQVGSKAVGIADLALAKFPAGKGFIVTTDAFNYYVEHNNLQTRLQYELADYVREDLSALEQASKNLTNIINRGQFPQDLAIEIAKAYNQLDSSAVAIRPSLTTVDRLSVGGLSAQLNISGDANLITAIRQTWAGLFQPRSLINLAKTNWQHKLAVIVQPMLPVEVGGVMYTQDPTSLFKGQIFIEAVWGNNSRLLSGQVIPDRYQIDRLDLEIKHQDVVEQRVAQQGHELIDVPLSKQKQAKLTSDQIHTLAELGKKLHQHYFFPQAIEWSWSKQTGFIIHQSQTIQPQERQEKLATVVQQPLYNNLRLLATGSGQGKGIVTGKVTKVKTFSDLSQVSKGDIVVCPTMFPDLVLISRKAAAIVAEVGGFSSHAAIITRELSVPCIVGANQIYNRLRTNQLITVDAGSGKIYDGTPPSRPEQPTPKPLQLLPDNLVTATKLYSLPDSFADLATAGRGNSDGVWLDLNHFWLTQSAHPKELLLGGDRSRLADDLTEILLKASENFGNRSITVALSDLNSNLTSKLTYASQYEPEEVNPLIGFRGLTRHLSSPSLLRFELSTIAKFINTQPNANIKLIIPPARNPSELLAFKQELAKVGLLANTKLELWLKLLSLANILELADYKSIGLTGVVLDTIETTSLITATDPTNQELKTHFNPYHPSLFWFLETMLDWTSKSQLKSGILINWPSINDNLIDLLVNKGVSFLTVKLANIDISRAIIQHAELKNIKH